MNKDNLENTGKVQPNKKDMKISSADDLTKTNKSELDEEELKRVTGGAQPVDGSPNR